MEHVGGLSDACEEIAVGNHYRRVCRVGVGKKLDGGSIGIFGRTKLDGIIGTLGSDAVGVRDPLEGANIGFRGKNRKFVADQSIERMYPRHFRPPHVSFPQVFFN